MSAQIEKRAMRRPGIVIGTVALTAVAGAGCDDVTNPVEEFGQLKGAYVRFVSEGAIGTPESTNRAIFVITTRVEEDVEITYTFGGDAVFGTDFVAVDGQGNVRTDVTSAGGKAIIEYDPTQVDFPRDTLRLFVPFAAQDGRRVTVDMTSARTASGRELDTELFQRFSTYTLDIEGFIDIPTGTWSAIRTGDFGTATGSVTITKPATPIIVEGESFLFSLSDFQGNPAGVFGAPVPWALNVSSGGTVFASPHSSQFANVTADVTGTFNRNSNTLTLNVTLSCCGGSGFGWQLVLTRP
jgi:hypothetical protein